MPSPWAMRDYRESHPDETPATRSMVEHQLSRQIAIGRASIARRGLRMGLFYTRAGVLDMTRRPFIRAPQAEQILLDTRDAITDTE